jgi:DNA mismatch endonuclease (patch repair protein)
VPKANRAYWVAKIGRNRQRDAESQRRLAEMGWRCLCLFECELKDRAALAERLRGFLSEGPA